MMVEYGEDLDVVQSYIGVQTNRVVIELYESVASRSGFSYAVPEIFENLPIKIEYVNPQETVDVQMTASSVDLEIYPSDQFSNSRTKSAATLAFSQKSGADRKDMGL